MSHRPERKEKICLNCRTEIHGRFCHVCGQENVETKETFWHLLTHFVYDITHFDGKFFSTLKLLLFKPGFLSAEYMNGRRTSYLNPIRMYVFTSAFFFLFFFSFVATEDVMKVSDTTKVYTTARAQRDIKNKLEDVRDDLQDDEVSAAVKKLLQQQIASLKEDSLRVKTDSNHLENLWVYKHQEIEERSDTSGKYYDSVQLTLPKAKRDSWLEHKFRIKRIAIGQKYAHDTKAIITAIMTKFFHMFPQVLFVSLPLFAMLLRLLYFRRRQYYYGDHAIYTIHLYCAMFIMIFLEIIFSRVSKLPHFRWVSYIALFFLFFILWYIYKSMRNFYKQSRKKTILKYSILMFLSFFVMVLLSAMFFIFSLFTI